MHYTKRQTELAGKIKTNLLNATDSGASLEMFCAIERKAKKGGEYQKLFKKWLNGGGTLVLRDDLAHPFKNSSLIKMFPNSNFFNMWAFIDAARAKSG